MEVFNEKCSDTPVTSLGLTVADMIGIVHNVSAAAGRTILTSASCGGDDTKREAHTSVHAPRRGKVTAATRRLSKQTSSSASGVHPRDCAHVSQGRYARA